MDALRQDAGRDQREPRRGRGAGQRLKGRSATRYTQLNSASFCFLSALYDAHWPGEICRAGSDRENNSGTECSCSPAPRCNCRGWPGGGSLLSTSSFDQILRAPTRTASPPEASNPVTFFFFICKPLYDAPFYYRECFYLYCHLSALRATV